jgi:hypothetical protein
MYKVIKAKNIYTDTYINGEGTGGMAQVVECLPSKQEALKKPQYCQKLKK